MARPAAPTDTETLTRVSGPGSPVTSPASDATAPDSATDDTSSEALEAALEQLGPFGLYQRYVLVMLCIPNLFAAMYSLNYVFVADQVPFRCVVPECEGTAPQFDNATAQALLPPDTRCRRYTPLLDAPTCDPHHFHPNDTVPCEAFVYETMDTIYAEFGLACREWLRTAVGSVRNAALPVALILTGYISDSWGRRTAFCIFSACAGVMGIMKAFSINYQMYIAMEFLEAALGYGFNSAGYVMMLEQARPSHRAAYASASGAAYGAGGMLFAFVAWQAPYWRHLLYIIHSFALLLPAYWVLLDESPRWLHARGLTERTASVVRKAARWNKVSINAELMQKLSGNVTKNEDVEPERNPWVEVVRSRVLMARLAVCSWCWVAAAFVYYGLTINSVNLSGDKYVNFALNMSMEVAASLLLVMALERFGRKWSICGAFLLCGVACVAPHFVSHDGTVFGLFLTGKLAISFAFNSLYVFTAELFPTRTRSSALAACSLLGRAGSILAPHTPLLSVRAQALLYAACSCSAALAALAAPETRRAHLPPRARHAERMRARPAPPRAPRAPRAPRVLSAHT